MHSLVLVQIHNQWRKIMRMAKVEELRREIEVLSQNHEREVDRKDAIVQVSGCPEYRSFFSHRLFAAWAASGAPRRPHCL